jgi:hypothetical protein
LGGVHVLPAGRLQFRFAFAGSDTRGRRTTGTHREEEDVYMWRRAVVLAAGLAMTASAGLMGAGAASAATTGSLHIADGSTWTLVVNAGGCQVDVFSSTGRFYSPETQFGGDAGTWSGGGSTLKMVWKKGDNAGLTFKGTYTKTPVKEYVGQMGGTGPVGYSGEVVKGVVVGC